MPQSHGEKIDSKDIEPDYSDSTVTVTLYPGPECDIDELHKDVNDFAAEMVAKNHVMVDVERKEHGNFKPR